MGAPPYFIVVTIAYSLSGFESKTIAATVPADLPEPSGLVMSSALPSAGTANTVTAYSITPETANGVDRFYVSIDRYGSDSTTDTKSGYGWMYFQTVSADSDSLTLDDGSVVPFLTVTSSSLVSDDTYYNSVNFYLSGREGYSMSNLTTSSGRRTDIIKKTLPPQSYYRGLFKTLFL